MSLKIDEFASIVAQPLNTYNFVVDIPGVGLDMLVESTTFPSEALQKVSLWYHGEEISYPTLPKFGGEWKVTVPESDTGITKRAFDALKNNSWSQKLGILKPKDKYFDCTVYARDMEDKIIFKVVLHRCFIMGRDGQDLNNSKADGVWKWNYVFHYSWIEDVDIVTD